MMRTIVHEQQGKRPQHAVHPQMALGMGSNLTHAQVRQSELTNGMPGACYKRRSFLLCVGDKVPDTLHTADCAASQQGGLHSAGHVAMPSGSAPGQLASQPAITAACAGLGPTALHKAGCFRR